LKRGDLVADPCVIPALLLRERPILLVSTIILRTCTGSETRLWRKSFKVRRDEFTSGCEIE
jgi:hypothetical protein